MRNLIELTAKIQELYSCRCEHSAASSKKLFQYLPLMDQIEILIVSSLQSFDILNAKYCHYYGMAGSVAWLLKAKAASFKQRSSICSV